MAHSIDACSALDKYLDELPKLEQTKFLSKLLCFNRHNRPAIRSEKWFFLDVLLDLRSTLEDEEGGREGRLHPA